MGRASSAGARIRAARERGLMLGPRIVGENGVELRPPTLEDYKKNAEWQMLPEVTRFWGPRFSTRTSDWAADRLRKDAESKNGLSWSISYNGEHVGFTGVFDINWVTRDGETGIFIGRFDLYGRGIASEAVRLRMGYIWNELGLRRAHNWIALANEGSW